MPTITANGVNLYYERHGRGRPLLLIHGLGSSTRDWEYQVPAFAEEYEVILCDVRGHGRSDKPPGPYSVPLFAADVLSLMRYLDILPAHVVGISMGGMIAFQMAADAPEALRSMVIVNSVPELLIKGVRERLEFSQRLLITRFLGMRRMGRFLAQRMFPEPEQAEIRRTFEERWAENDRRAYLEALKAVVNWSVADRLPEMDIPALIVAGEFDSFPLETKRAYAARMPRAEVVVVPDSRHGTPVDQPETFNRLVLDFLRRVEQETL